MGITDAIRNRAAAWVREVAQTPAPAPVSATPMPTVRTEGSSSDTTALACATAAQLARRFEGLRLRPYLCPAGKPTIGYGATYYEGGRAVTLKDPPITKERAEVMLELMVRRVYLPAVQRLCPGIKEPGQLAALIDFAYNLGAGNLQSSTLRKRVNAGRWQDVPVELRKWIMAKGRIQRGLKIRREAEIGVLAMR